MIKIKEIRLFKNIQTFVFIYTALRIIAYFQCVICKRTDTSVVDCVLSFVAKLRESARTLWTQITRSAGYLDAETIIINNLARPLLSELQSSNLRPKPLNCRGQDSSQKNTVAFHAGSTSSFYADGRHYVHQSAGVRKVSRSTFYLRFL